MRKQFNEQLNMLKVELIHMGALCEEAILAAIKALLDADQDMLEKANMTSIEIDQIGRDIEALCMKMLLRQQPVARDLRMISSAMKMISDMERIGTQASDIAEITRYIKHSDTISKMNIRDMSQATIKMVTDSVESFIRKDLELANAVVNYDDVVDQLFDKVKIELIGLLTEDKAYGQLCLDLLMIAKYFERIGDHAVNIARWVEYSITGKHHK